MKKCTGIILTDKTVAERQSAITSISPLVNELLIISTKQHPLNGDFASHRNWAMKQAKNDWILFLDGDEVFSPEAATSIKEIPENTDAGSFYFKREDWFWGKKLTHGEPSNCWVPRLVNRIRGTFTRPVHEEWHGDNPQKAKGIINHYAHTSISEFMDTVNRYSSINARYYFENGKKATIGDIVLTPLLKFAYTYFIKLGWMDGMPGMVYCYMMSFHSFLTRSKLYLLQHPPLK